MSGDWIKMRVDLPDDPAVIAIAARLCITQDEVVGKLHRLWSWADRHTDDGSVDGVSFKWVDEYIKRKGFAAAMAATGWLEESVSGIFFPAFQRHNGKSAKVRAEDARRKKTDRARQLSPPNVREMSGEKSDKNRTREEKRSTSLEVLPNSEEVGAVTLAAKPVADKSAEKPNPTHGGWKTDPAAAVAKGAQFGVEPRVGESQADFTARIGAAMAARWSGRAAVA